MKKPQTALPHGLTACVDALQWERDKLLYNYVGSTAGSPSELRKAISNSTKWEFCGCLLYTSPSPRDAHES
eukprot:1291665-Prymnesium_polylepis.1